MTEIVERTVHTHRPGMVSAYLADFRNAVEWDAGTVSCDLVSGDGGPGSHYCNVSRFAGRAVEPRLRPRGGERPAHPADWPGWADHGPRHDHHPSRRGAAAARWTTTPSSSSAWPPASGPLPSSASSPTASADDTAATLAAAPRCPRDPPVPAGRPDAGHGWFCSGTGPTRSRAPQARPRGRVRPRPRPPSSSPASPASGPPSARASPAPLRPGPGAPRRSAHRDHRRFHGNRRGRGPRRVRPGAHVHLIVRDVARARGRRHPVGPRDRLALRRRRPHLGRRVHAEVPVRRHPPPRTGAQRGGHARGIREIPAGS